MARLRWISLVGLTALLPCLGIAGEWYSWRTWRAEWQQNLRWPEQHLDADRAAVRAPFCQMIANGWRSQNTIANYHFNEETGELNDTGRLKVRSVVRETPVEYRTLYVLRADGPDLTAARVKSVQEYAYALAQDDPLPPILVTTIEPRGTRGDVSHGVYQRLMENAPAPVLPPATREDASGS